MTENEVVGTPEAPNAPAAPAVPATEFDAVGNPISGGEALPAYVSRPIGVNQFRIYANDKPVGKSLTPVEAGTVIKWLHSIGTDEV